MEKQHKIDVWVNNALLLSDRRPSPLLMHTSPPDESKELHFWNSLRDYLKDRIQVHYFDHLEEAGEVVVTPHLLRDYKSMGNLDEICQVNQETLSSGRKLITFTGGPDYTPLKGEIVFSASAYKNTDDCFCTPLWLYDRGVMPKIKKPEKPTAAFIAQAFYPGRVSNFVGKLPTTLGIENYLACHEELNRKLPLNGCQTIARLVRQRVYKTLLKATKVDLELKIRKLGFFSHTPEERKVLKREYVDAMKNHIYNICVRGDANCIFQIFDFMSAGRIPVFVDTNSQLPRLKGMNWEDFCILVPFDKINQIEDYILDFHQKHSEKDIWEKMDLARKAYEQLLPLSFIQNYVMPVLTTEQIDFPKEINYSYS